MNAIPLGTTISGDALSLGANAWATSLVCAVTLLGVLAAKWPWKRASAKARAPRPATENHDDLPAFPNDPPRRRDDQPVDSDTLVDEMIAQSRFALLLRTQLISNLAPRQLQAARDALADAMSLVPEGDVDLLMPDECGEEGRGDIVGTAPESIVTVRVGALYLDRFAVTNRQFREFVLAGGYEQMSIWDPHVWPAVLDFVDITGHLGPRFWKHGRYPAREENHPVVGLSWYEASAYARWAGKRLPTDAEWVKAGAWPVPVSASARCQRKFPWGERADAKRANLWSSGIGKTVPVTDFDQGASVGGVVQLTGNVWEWTTGDFGSLGGRLGKLCLPTPMKSIRGGAFDTYLDTQGACQFQSGENPLSRRHNIGFRCAISLGDLAPESYAPDHDDASPDRQT